LINFSSVSLRSVMSKVALITCRASPFSSRENHTAGIYPSLLAVAAPDEALKLVYFTVAESF
jgi:hypothetical protein